MHLKQREIKLIEIIFKCQAFFVLNVVVCTCSLQSGRISLSFIDMERVGFGEILLKVMIFHHFG